MRLSIAAILLTLVALRALRFDGPADLPPVCDPERDLAAMHAAEPPFRSHEIRTSLRMFPSHHAPATQPAPLPRASARP